MSPLAAEATGREARRQAILKLLGLARRAGALRMGATAVVRALREEPPGVVVLARDAGGDLAGKIEHAHGRSRVEAELFDAEELASRFGRERLSVVSVHEAGFVAGLERHLSE